MHVPYLSSYTLLNYFPATSDHKQGPLRAPARVSPLREKRLTHYVIDQTARRVHCLGKASDLDRTETDLDSLANLFAIADEMTEAALAAATENQNLRVVT